VHTVAISFCKLATSACSPWLARVTTRWVMNFTNSSMFCAVTSCVHIAPGAAGAIRPACSCGLTACCSPVSMASSSSSLPLLERSLRSAVLPLATIERLLPLGVVPVRPLVLLVAVAALSLALQVRVGPRVQQVHGLSIAGDADAYSRLSPPRLP